MSTISALNNVQQQVTSLASSTATDTAKTSSGETFGKALDIAMDAKGLVLPSTVNTAIDAGAMLFEEQGVVSAASDISAIKDNLEDVLGGLSTGIASSLIAALAGADSATAVTPPEDSKTLVASLADIVIEKNGLVSAQDIEDTKKLIDSISPYLPDNKANTIATSALSSLEDTLLENEDEDDEESNS